MNFKRSILPGLLILALSTALSGQSQAKSWVETAKKDDRTRAEVVKNHDVLLRTTSRFKELRVVDASVADVTVLTDLSFQITGKNQGRTNVMIYDEKGRLIDIVDIDVNYDLPGLRQALSETMPREKIAVRSMADGIYLSGEVSDQAASTRAASIAAAYAPDQITNGIVVRDSHQVMLEVRFVEASRDTVKSLGISLLSEQAGEFAFQSGVPNAAATFTGVIEGMIGSASLDARLDALEEDGVIRTLAEPNLVSMSGKTASFLAGGEFPIPVQADLGQVTIEYRQFGVGLAFTPTVLGDGIVNLEVEPEVSQLDTSNSVRVGGVEVPSLRVRRAKTTIELRNSQSFAIAGLLQNETVNRKTQTPWIGDIPVIGSLFRSSRYQQAETELVIIVTPRLVQPVSDADQLRTPLDDRRVPNEVETFLMGQIDGAKAIEGLSPEDYGYVTQ